MSVPNVILRIVSYLNGCYLYNDINTRNKKKEKKEKREPI
jgi:hypothetical protein